MNNESKRYTLIDSPVGKILIAGTSETLTQVWFLEGKHPVKIPTEWQADDHLFKEAIAQLDAYFERKLFTFDLPLRLEGTPFQIEVWNALKEIPYGKTISYGELARRIDRPKAVRAVGAANGQNPISIIVPCHRVIGSNGSLTGYGGGLKNKEALLALEQGRVSRLTSQASLFE
ncbi:MAG: methylated-DNA--[protein]-cysteine S-methyltransferase [Acidobacteriota bacterium]